MKSTATLIKKQKPRSNFKLTFANKRGELYLFLHESKEDIFNNLKINQEYSFSAHKGRKSYFFVNPQSIKAIKHQYLPIKPNQDIRNMFFNNLLKDLKIRDLTEANINAKISELKEIRGKTKQEEKNLLLTLTKDYIKTLILKHRGLEGTETILDQGSNDERELLETIDYLLYFFKVHG